MNIKIKKHLCGLLLLAASEAASANAFVLDELYVPHTFTSQEQTFIAVHGYFKDQCTTWDEHKIDIDEVRNKIDVTLNTRIDETFCPPLIEPLTQEIVIGRLDPGEYLVTIVSNGLVRANFSVEPNSPTHGTK